MALIVGGGFPVGDDTELVADLFDLEVMLPESSPCFGGKFFGFGMEQG